MPTRRASTGVRYAVMSGRGNTSRWSTRFPLGNGQGGSGSNGH